MSALKKSIVVNVVMLVCAVFLTVRALQLESRVQTLECECFAWKKCMKLAIEMLKEKDELLDRNERNFKSLLNVTRKINQ